MKNYDQSVKINLNPNLPYIPDHFYIILIIGGSGSGKTRRVLIVFDMIADMESNKKMRSYCYWIVFKRKKTQYFTCFYITILFKSA